MADEDDKPKKKGKKADADAAAAKPEKAERVEKGEQRAKGRKGKGEAEAKPAPARPQKEVPPVIVENYVPRMLETYKSQVAPALQKRFSYKSAMQVPRLVKITLNVGLGEATQNPKLLDAAAAEIAAVTGQKPVIQRAKKAIANFRLRENQRIGVTVTLRRQRMWEFLDRLINVGLPRVRDFRGVSPRAFDGRGNYTLGLREQIIFPEVDYDRVEKIRGLNVSIVTTARTDEEGLALLTGLGMPFRT